MNMNLSDYTLEDLEALRVDVWAELERRQRMAAMPATITAMVDAYLAAGGSKSDLNI